MVQCLLCTLDKRKSCSLTQVTDDWQAGKRFVVVVVDARPGLEGRNMLRRLLAAGIACQYTLLNAASFVMQVHTISAYLQVGSNDENSMEKLWQ